MAAPPAPTSRPAAPPRVQHHLLLCATPTKPLCGDPALGAQSWQRLKELVRDLGLEDPARPDGVVLRTKADCLRVCRDGPVLWIWPEGVIYGGVTPERIERIVREHLLEGRPIEAWILGRSGFEPPPRMGPGG
ncbi:MAG: (2Fe-2S) ferredoxin domain-containing protein [Synechococcaceae cyanobacterium]